MGEEFNFPNTGVGASVPPLLPPSGGEIIEQFISFEKFRGERVKNKYLCSLDRHRKRTIVSARSLQYLRQIILDQVGTKKNSYEVNICEYLG